jgi:hypothetical protein
LVEQLKKKKQDTQVIKIKEYNYILLNNERNIGNVVVVVDSETAKARALISN